MIKNIYDKINSLFNNISFSLESFLNDILPDETNFIDNKFYIPLKLKPQIHENDYNSFCLIRGKSNNLHKGYICGFGRYLDNSDEILYSLETEYPKTLIYSLPNQLDSQHFEFLYLKYGLDMPISKDEINIWIYKMICLMYLEIQNKGIVNIS